MQRYSVEEMRTHLTKPYTRECTKQHFREPLFQSHICNNLATESTFTILQDPRLLSSEARRTTVITKGEAEGGTAGTVTIVTRDFLT